MTQNFYLHFETKPSFSELDKLFDQCEQFQPVMATSYLLVFDTTGKTLSCSSLVKQLFPRYRYALVQFAKNGYHQNSETPYAKISL